MEFITNRNTISCEAILFDLDGTLVQSTGPISEILQQWAIAQRLDADQVLSFSHGKRTQDIVAHFIHDESVDEHYQTLTAQFLHVAQHTQVIDGAKDFLTIFNQRQLPWAVVSSSERALIHARLTAAGLPIPSVIVAAEDIQQGKPAPDGYLKAATWLNVPIQQCLVFEDSESGIQAAQSAGAQLIVIGQSSQQDLICIENFNHIKFQPPQRQL